MKQRKSTSRRWTKERKALSVQRDLLCESCDYLLDTLEYMRFKFNYIDVLTVSYYLAHWKSSSFFLDVRLRLDED
jgi:hypothetical protein